MKKYNIRANFEKNILVFPKIELVENDYNSVEFDFSFDDDEGTKYIEIKKPNGKVWVKEIVDNKVVLVDYDESGKVIPVITCKGDYEFEISKYIENSKYTINKTGFFEARDEIVYSNDEIEADVKLPILDDLINHVETLKNDCNESTTNANNAAESAKTATENANKKVEEINRKLKNGEFVGATGPSGKDGITPDISIGNVTTIEANEQATVSKRGTKENPIFDFEIPKGETGAQGIQGNPGKDGYTPKKGVDYFTGQDKSEMVSVITEDANSDFNQNAISKMNEFNENATNKLNDYNTNATNRINEFNENSESITNSVANVSNELERVKDGLFEVLEAEGKYIQLKDSAHLKIKEIEFEAEFEQETTKGRNFLPFPTNPFPVAGNDNVLTATKNEDGTIQIKGTKETTGWSTVHFAFGKSITLPAGTYTTQNGFLLGTVTESGTYKNNGGTFTMTEPWHFSGGYYQTSNIGNHDIKLLPMLVAGDTLGDFESYTEGKSSPNPKYPQPIKTLEGSFNIVVDSGKEETVADYLHSQITLNLPNGEFIGKFDEINKDTLKIKFNENDGKYHKVLHKMLKRVILDGNRVWYERINANGVKQFYTDAGTKGVKNLLQCCTHFANYNDSLYNYGKVNDFAIFTNTNIFICCVSDDMSLDDFKAKLNEKNLVAYYILNNPYEVDLGPIDIPITYDDETNIFTGNDLISNIKVKYYREFPKINELENILNQNTSDLMKLENMLDKNTVSEEIVRIDDAKEYKALETRFPGQFKQTTTTGANHYASAEDLRFATCSVADSAENLAVYDEYQNVVHIKQAVDYCKLAGFTMSDVFLNFIKAGDTITVLTLIKKASDTTVRVYYSAQTGSYQTLTKYKDLNKDWAYYYTNFKFDDNTTDFTPKFHFKTDGEIYVAKIQVSLGDTVKDFEPYTGGKPSPNPDYPQDIETIKGSLKLASSNKNFFDKNNVRKNYRFGSDGNYYAENGYYATEFIRVITNAIYSTSWSITQTTCICTYDKKFNFIRRIQVDNKFTTSNEEMYIRASVREDQLNIAQIELESNKTEYVEHKGSTYDIDLKGNELAKASEEVVDEVVIDKDSNIALIKRVGKVILNGSEDYTNNASSDLMYNFSTSVSGLNSVKYSYGKENGKSNYFKYLMNTSTSLTVDRVYTTNNNVVFITSCASTIDEFKSWLSAHNVTVYYELAEPQIISLGKLSEPIETFEETNYFYLVSNLQTQIQITYVQDLKKYYDEKIINQQSQIDEMKTLLSSTATSVMLLDNYQSDLESEVEV